jgi:hypothetical protein
MIWTTLAAISCCLTGSTASAQQASGVAGAAQTWAPVRLADGHPDLQGVWSFATLTPLERPKDLADKPFLTEEEAIKYAQQSLANSNADRRDGAGTDVEGRPGEAVDVGRAYNNFWFERGTSVVRTRRTSLITDPPDGKLPPLTAEGQKKASALDAFWAQEVRGPLDGVKTRPLRERCIWWETEGPPLTPMQAYNANFQLVQNQDNVVIFLEMIHDARIIPLDGRPHLPASIPQLLGDSRGHWEGDTLVIDTTNFKDKADYIDPAKLVDKKNAALWSDFRGASVFIGGGAAGAGAGPHAHLTERLTRVDANTLRYEFTMNDPTMWTKPWTAEEFLTKADTPIYEYACHEGNYGISGILSGARAKEKR